MKKNSFIKIFSMVCVFIMMFTITIPFAFGASGDFTEFSLKTTGVNQNAKNTANTILGFVQFIGYAIAVGMLIYVGIKYVMASADEKANLKNSLIRYVIGAILIAGASAISGWIFALGEQMK